LLGAGSPFLGILSGNRGASNRYREHRPEPHLVH
jgi:hypothetical protein